MGQQRIALGFALFFLFFSSGVAAHSPQELVWSRCKLALLSLLGMSSEEWIDDEVSILWFPRFPDGAPNYTHTKLRVGDSIFSYGRPKKGSFRGYKRLARTEIRKAFYEFRIRVTPIELRAIQDNLADDSTGFSCVYQACRSLSGGTMMSFPPLGGGFASFNATYLTLSRLKNKLWWGRVVEINYFGKSKVRRLISPDLFLDGMAASLGAFFGWLAYLISVYV